MSAPLVLSLFPGIGLLDRAFEEVGCVVVRGPDLLWGGDVHTFHAPAGKFDGVIGGPPCQDAGSPLAALNRHLGNRVRPDLTPEFLRVVLEARPAWWLMENGPRIPAVSAEGYIVHALRLNNRWLGEEQNRLRVFQFGTRDGRKLTVETLALEQSSRERTCMAGEGKTGTHHWGGKKRPKLIRESARPWPRFCELQGLPPDFLEGSPFTVNGKYRAVGEGVPLPMGRAIARAVAAVMFPAAVAV